MRWWPRREYRPRAAPFSLRSFLAPFSRLLSRRKDSAPSNKKDPAGFGKLQDVIDWLNETRLSGGQNLEVSEPDAPAALETVRNLRHAWKITLEHLMAGHGVRPQIIKQLNRILYLDTFSETLGFEGKIGFHLHRSRSLLAGQQLALAILARSISEFLITAEFKYLRRCANTESCVLVFYDTTKNHRREWCSNSMCGNRHKVAEFRRRERAARHR
jgi:predicted RNA-binding Zn ribbon-like protein